MARRKRLTPALIGGSEQALHEGAEPVRDLPPIARVASETASQAAFAEVAGALASAREEGRLIVKLPLDAIETRHLVRDRVALDPEEMAALEASLRARGQQVPVEVVPLEEVGDGANVARYGLVSGLRRIMALRAIGVAEALALVRRRENSAEAYLAMVEENEIRADISFYERARLASEAARRGIYTDVSTAITALFSSASPAKRSKIGAFVRVYEALNHTLRYPTGIPERLGLALAGAIDRDPEAAAHLQKRLSSAAPSDAAAERVAIEAALAEMPNRKTSAKTQRADTPRQVLEGVRIESRRGRVVLSGAGVTDALRRDLEAWLASRR